MRLTDTKNMIFLWATPGAVAFLISALYRSGLHRQAACCVCCFSAWRFIFGLHDGPSKAIMTTRPAGLKAKALGH